MEHHHFTEKKKSLARLNQGWGFVPEERFEDLDYETEERLDSTLVTSKNLEAGVNSQVHKLTTYKLVSRRLAVTNEAGTVVK